MTSGAKRVTVRATAAAREARAPGTMPATELRAFLQAFGDLGYDAGALAAAAGLRPADLANRDLRVPCAAYGAIAGHAMATRRERNLSLHVAARTPMGASPLLDYLILSSEDVLAGLRQLARYYRLVESPIAIDLGEGDPVQVRLIERGAAPFMIEYTVALIVLHFRRETDGRFHPLRLFLAHRPDDPAEFERTLQCPVDTAHGWSGLDAAPAACALPLRRRDPILRTLLEDQAQRALAAQPAIATLADEVCRVLATSAPHERGMPIDTVARRLATSRRTLQRRLAEEGCSYAGLVDRWRRETARRLVADSEVGLAEIAWLLGYAETAPFHRAFRRWFGVTPREAAIRARRARSAW